MPTSLRMIFSASVCLFSFLHPFGASGNAVPKFGLRCLGRTQGVLTHLALYQDGQNAVELFLDKDGVVDPTPIATYSNCYTSNAKLRTAECSSSDHGDFEIESSKPVNGGRRLGAFAEQFPNVTFDCSGYDSSFKDVTSPSLYCDLTRTDPQTTSYRVELTDHHDETGINSEETSVEIFSRFNDFFDDKDHEPFWKFVSGPECYMDMLPPFALICNVGTDQSRSYYWSFKALLGPDGIQGKLDAESINGSHSRDSLEMKCQGNIWPDYL